MLSGSAGRDMATDRSDLHVFVVLGDTGTQGSRTNHSAATDETLVAIAGLERVPPFGTNGWWYRWSFAWAPVLLDRTQGRLASALRRQATVTADEAESILVEQVRLDGWLNHAYRALKNHPRRGPVSDSRDLRAHRDTGRNVRHGHPELILTPIIDGWGDELQLLRR